VWVEEEAGVSGEEGFGEREWKRERESVRVYTYVGETVYVGGEGVCVCESAWSPTQ